MSVCKVSMNTTTTNHSNVITDIRLAKEAGFDGIEIQDPHLYRYLDLGLPIERLQKELGSFPVSSVGCLHDIANYHLPEAPFIDKVKRMCETAAALGAPMIQGTTGPTDFELIREYHRGNIAPTDSRYLDVLGLSDEEQIYYTAEGVRKIAEIASSYGLKLCIEPLAEAPVHTIRQTLDVIQQTGCSNIGVLVDFWHVWNGGESPEDISRLDPSCIANVHICDNVPHDRKTVWPMEPEMRDVWIGEGDIPIHEYVQAVKSTGYDGWYTFETFSRKAWEEDLLTCARTVKEYLDMVLF